MLRDRPLGYRLALILGLGATVLIALGDGLPAQDSPSPAYLRPAKRCPSDLEGLTASLLAELPSYANRVASRNLRLSIDQASAMPPNIVVVAGLPDFTPIDLADFAPGLGPGDSAAGDFGAGLEQVFFTTLERQYWRDQTVSLQNYHWLFLAPTDEGWHLALLYSTLGTYPPGHRAPTPPQESSDGIVGQAVRLWLRDCRAEAVFLMDGEPAPSDTSAPLVVPVPSTEPPTGPPTEPVTLPLIEPSTGP